MNLLGSSFDRRTSDFGGDCVHREFEWHIDIIKKKNDSMMFQGLAGGILQ